MSRTDLQSDLLADLQGASYAAPAPVAPVAPPAAAAGTPTLDVRVTPLRWSRVRLSASVPGSGLALHAGPVQVRVSR